MQLLSIVHKYKITEIGQFIPTISKIKNSAIEMSICGSLVPLYTRAFKVSGIKVEN